MKKCYSTLLSDFKLVGMWEYNAVKDTISLCPNASKIYFGNNINEEVNISEIFARLTPKSSQYMSSVLTAQTNDEQIFSQHVYRIDYTTKEVLTIVKAGDDGAFGITVDIEEY